MDVFHAFVNVFALVTFDVVFKTIAAFAVVTAIGVDASMVARTGICKTFVNVATLAAHFFESDIAVASVATTDSSIDNGD